MNYLEERRKWSAYSHCYKVNRSSGLLGPKECARAKGNERCSSRVEILYYCLWEPAVLVVANSDICCNCSCNFRASSFTASSVKFMIIYLCNENTIFPKQNTWNVSKECNIIYMEKSWFKSIFKRNYSRNGVDFLIIVQKYKRTLFLAPWAFRTKILVSR